jgi:hypothetical protein
MLKEFLAALCLMSSAAVAAGRIQPCAVLLQFLWPAGDACASVAAAPAAAVAVCAG